MHGKLLILFLTMLALAGCGNDPTSSDQEATELALYRSAQSNLLSGNYGDAVAKLQLLEARFPFGRYAEQAQLEIIYAYYRSSQPEAARTAADRFIRLHPQHPNVDYAWYLRGMASFDEDKGIISSLIPTDTTKRDPGAARNSFNDFSQLIQRFPNSEYAPDAQRRMRFLKNLLAEAEVHVAEYYIRRGAYIAAANRGRYVFENFQGTPAVPEALGIMVKAYRLLELDDLADQSQLVLTTNFPNHGSIDSDGQFRKQTSEKRNGRSWLNILSFGLLGRSGTAAP